jgi:hypothetical protein
VAAIVEQALTALSCVPQSLQLGKALLRAHQLIHAMENLQQ